MCRRTYLSLCVALVAATFGMTGCARQRIDEPIVLGTSALLFGRAPTAIAATEIGRPPWPATIGRLESVEETTFVEYYRDYQGSASQESYSPRKSFRSYRVGTQLR